MTAHRPLYKLAFFALLAGCAFWSVRSVADRFSSVPVLDVWMLDVGQGESILLREPTGKKLLFDGGPSDAVLSELGDVLPPWDRSIDLVVLSHNHSDHIRGLISVIERYKIGEIWTSGALEDSDDFRTFQEEAKEKNIPLKNVFFSGKSCLALVCPPATRLGSLSLQVYHPLKDARGDNPADQHDDTVVLKASYERESILLPGDLNEGHESDILAACPPPRCTLAATIFQVPHHGSGTGLAPPFLAAVRPQAALIPVGLNNVYRHPALATLQKLAKARIPTYRTDRQGRVHLTVYADRFSVEAAK